jgi:hypothetical protein
MKNKHLNTRKPKSPREDLEIATTNRGKLSARQLREKVYLLEVEVASAPRLQQERYLRNLNTVPPPEIARKKSTAARSRLTHAQLQARKRRQMLLFGEFVFGCILLAGALAWVVKAWQAWSR